MNKQLEEAWMQIFIYIAFIKEDKMMSSTSGSEMVQDHGIANMNLTPNPGKSLYASKAAPEPNMDRNVVSEAGG